MAVYGNKKVLFLEPNQTIRTSITSIFKNLGMDITTTVTPDVGDARNRVKNSVYDIIISEFDLGKGERTGQQFLEELRIEKLISASTGFIITTTVREREEVLSALEYRPDEYLIKPFKEADIGDRLVSTIEKKVYFGKVYDAIFLEKYDKALQELNYLSRGNKYPLDLIRLKLVCFLKQSDYQSVVGMYESIAGNSKLKKIADFPWFRYSYAKALYHLGKYQQAEEISSDLKQKFPNYMENYKLLADILHAEMKDELSLEILKIARDLSPLNVERQIVLGKHALLNGDLETAAEASKFVIDKGSKSCLYSIDAHANLAHIYGEMGKFDEALNILNDGIDAFVKTDPVGSQFACAVMESQIYAKKGDEKEAKSAFGFALDLFHTKMQGSDGGAPVAMSDDIKLFFGAECLQNGHPDIAQELISEVMQNTSHRVDALEKHLKKSLRNDESVSTFDGIMETVKPKEPAGIFEQMAGESSNTSGEDFQSAMEKIHSGDLHEAAQILESIVDGAFDHAKTTYQNAMENVKSGDWKKAISILKLENLRNPENPSTYFDLAKFSFFFLEKKLDTVYNNDSLYEKMFGESKSYLDSGLALLNEETSQKFKSEVGVVNLLISKLEKKRTELKEKRKKFPEELKTGDVGFDDILPDFVLPN